MTHGLPFLTREMLTGEVVPSWSADFDAWAADALSRGDVDTLAAYKSKAPGMPFAHPTVDHYVPLFITLGAAEREDQPVETVIKGYMAGLVQALVPSQLTRRSWPRSWTAEPNRHNRARKGTSGGCVASLGGPYGTDPVDRNGRLTTI